MKNKILFVALTVVGASALSTQANETSTILSEWNIITSGDLQNVTDFFGNAYVGGNVTVGSSFNAANNDKNSPTPGNVSLAVVGNINGGGNITIGSGNVVVGGSIASGRIVNNNGGGTITQGNPALLPSSPVAQITSASQYWSKLSANSVAAVVGNNINFNCAANADVAVFNVTASQLFAQNQNLNLNTASGTKQILINVSGATPTELNSENFNGFQNNANNVVFNFYDATSVNFDGGSAYGYIVAPGATVSGISPIVGGVAAATLNTGSEVELPNGAANYIGMPDVLQAVPDAGATAALLGASLSGVAAIRRKYSKS